MAHHAPALREYQAATCLGLLFAMGANRGGTYTVLFPRQAGKNEVAARLVAALLCAHSSIGGEVVVAAPTYSPQAEISVERVRAAVYAVRPFFADTGHMRLTANTVSVGLATATFLSASADAHVAGHTASIALIADEAQEIDRDWFDRQFRPMTASTGAPAVLFGTPWDGESLLDIAVEENRRFDAASTLFFKRHYQVSWEEVAIANPRYGAHVRRERERLGAANPLFITQYGLRTAAAAGKLLTVEQMGSLIGLHGWLSAPVAGERYVAGLDIGGDGARADSTILTIARLDGRAIGVVQITRWTGAEYAALEEEVAALARAWGLARIAADGSGLGGPVVARLAAALGDCVERVTFTGSTKSELGYGLLAAVNAGTLHLPADATSERQACLAELRACGAVFHPGGRLQWGGPAGVHDDFAVSLALCVRAAGRDPGPKIARGRRRQR